MEEAIRKITSAAVLKMRIHDRAFARGHLVADIVIFDPETIADREYSIKNPLAVSSRSLRGLC